MTSTKSKTGRSNSIKTVGHCGLSLSGFDVVKCSVICCLIAASLLLNQTSVLGCQFDPESSIDSTLIDLKTQKSINSGLKYLASNQNKDGSFGDGSFQRNAAVCSLAGLAFLSEGSIPGQGKYGKPLQKCLDFVLSRVQPNGFISSDDLRKTQGPMYGHGFATLFLAEAYGTKPTPEVRAKLSKAVQLIIDTQNSEGGWRYDPQRSGADISVTICQIMALRAARNAGIFVPNATVDACINYVKRSQNGDGGFMYLLEGGESAFPRSAAGLVALFNAGVYSGEEVDNALKYLLKFKPGTKGGIRDTHYFYGHYYAVQAMWQAGGKLWAEWYPAIQRELLDSQQANGSWVDGISPEYGTAMACIILQMPNNYLPIFQR